MDMITMTVPKTAMLTRRELFLAFFNAPRHDRSASVLARNPHTPEYSPSDNFSGVDLLDNYLSMELTEEVRNLTSTDDDPVEILENLAMEFRYLADEARIILADFEKLCRDCEQPAPNDDEDSDEWKACEARDDLYEVDGAVLASVVDSMHFDDDAIEPVWKSIRAKVAKSMAETQIKSVATSAIEALRA